MKKRSTLCSASLLGLLAILPDMASADQGVDLRELVTGDPFFYTNDQIVKEDDGQKTSVGMGRPTTTHSRIPHLPFYVGYMNTNYTYRFATVAEQVFTLIGEGKHGLWRVQESGYIREYRRANAAGIEQDARLDDPKNLAAIERDYSSFLPEEGYDGYKYPDQKVTSDGRLNFIDLPISHPKYRGRYADHDPIDLANFYCTMSEADYPYAFAAMRFAFQQPGANVVGPLGKRAGLDVKENYTRVLRLNHMPDARSWVNVGQAREDALHVDWKPIDREKSKAEYYIVERPFFNKPYLFVVAVFEPADNRGFSYLRPDGDYYRSLGDRAKGIAAKVETPNFPLEGGGFGKAVGLPVYGVHHPDRAAYKGGGACPLKGGDWGRYPDPSGGSAWPTHYEEVTPLCDAVLVDIKFYSNLDGRDWNDPKKYLANAGFGTKTVEYKMQPGDYGKFSDPYNVRRGHENADRRSVPETLGLTYRTVQPPVSYTPLPKVERAAAMTPTPSTSCRQVRAK